MKTNHAERDRRFAYVSTGDITSWARTCSSPKIGRVVRMKHKSARPEVSPDAVRSFTTKAEEIRSVSKGPMVPLKVIPKGKTAPDRDREIEKMDKQIANTAKSLEISNKFNALFASQGANMFR